MKHEQPVRGESLAVNESRHQKLGGVRQAPLGQSLAAPP